MCCITVGSLSTLKREWTRGGGRRTALSVGCQRLCQRLVMWTPPENIRCPNLFRTNRPSAVFPSTPPNTQHIAWARGVIYSLMSNKGTLRFAQTVLFTFYSPGVEFRVSCSWQSAEPPESFLYSILVSLCVISENTFLFSLDSCFLLVAVRIVASDIYYYYYLLTIQSPLKLKNICCSFNPFRQSSSRSNGWLLSFLDTFIRDISHFSWTIAAKTCF